MIGNPIFRREIHAASRDPRVSILMLAFVLILAAILILLWPANGIFSLASEGSMQIFVIFLMANLTLICLFVPALSSSAVTSERENRSFDLLFTSLLTPTEILTGKLFASLSMILGVVVISMPIGAICSLSGGIGPQLLLRCYAVIAVAAVTYGMIGLAVSALCRRTVTSLVVTYCMIGMLAGSTWLPAALLGRFEAGRSFWQVLRNLSPYDAMYSLILPTQYRLASDTWIYQSSAGPFWTYLIGMGCVALLALCVFARSISSPPRPERVCRTVAWILIAVLVGAVYGEYQIVESARNATGSDFGTNVAEKLSVLFVAVDIGLLMIIRGLLAKSAKLTELAKGERKKEEVKAAEKKSERPPKRRCISLWRNPFYVAEMRSKFFGRPTFIIRSLYTCVAISILLLILVARAYATSASADTVRWVAVVYQVGLVALLAPLVSSGAITDEITGKTMLSLRMTPLSALALVAGKLKASLVYVSVFLAASLPVMLSLAAMEAEGAFWRVGIWFGILVLTALVLTSAGLCASAFSQQTAVATGISYGFAAVICVCTFGVLLPGAFDLQTQRMVLTANPIVASVRVTSNELFAQLPDAVWVDHIALMLVVSVALLSAASVRIYGIFSCRT